MDRGSHPNLDRGFASFQPGGEIPLNSQGGFDAGHRIGEHGEHRVALRGHPDPVGHLDSSVDDSLVVLEHLAEALLTHVMQDLGRSLDINEHEGDCPGG